MLFRYLAAATVVLATSGDAFVPTVTSRLTNRQLRAVQAPDGPNVGEKGHPSYVEIQNDDYVAVGLACCFQLIDGKAQEHWIYEPLTAGTLECLEKGVETSYKQVMAMRADDFFVGDVWNPQGVQMDNLAHLSDGVVEEDKEVHLCHNVVERTHAAIRTFRRRAEAKTLEFNELSDEYNFSTKRKRILNQVYEPSFDDNVKQDKSIDVYGREGEGGVDLDKQIEELANA